MLKPYKRIKFKDSTVNCYLFGTKRLVPTAFNVGDYDHGLWRHHGDYYFKNFENGISCGVAIEPVPEERMKTKSEVNLSQMPRHTFEENTVLLFFQNVEGIDLLIGELNRCKAALRVKLESAKKDKHEEEYKRKFCGKVIGMEEYKDYKPELAERITGRTERQIQTAAACAMAREHFASVQEIPKGGWS